MHEEFASLGEVLFEFVPTPRAMAVHAMHVASATEVSIFGPLSASQRDLERLALRKLAYVLKRAQAAAIPHARSA